MEKKERKNKKINLVFFFIIAPLLSCMKDNIAQNEESEAIFHIDDICPTVVAKAKLLQAVVDIPKMQSAYHKDFLYDNKQLVIKRNMFFSDSITISKFGYPVKILSINEIVNKGIKGFIDIKELTIKRDKAFIYFKYDIEGLGCKATFKSVRCNWELENVLIWNN